MSRITKLPRGAYVRHAGPGCPIELVTWKTGGEIHIETLTVRQAREIALALQQAALREEMTMQAAE